VVIVKEVPTVAVEELVTDRVPVVRTLHTPADARRGARDGWPR